MSTAELFLIWSLPIAIAAHNLEEAIWLPAWSQAKTGRWRRPVGAAPFRFAVVILTGLAFLLAGLTHIYGWSSIWHYLLASYALGQGLNVFFPHLLATLISRAYMPGLLSGVCIVLPAAARLLYVSFVRGYLEPARFLPIAFGFIVALLVAIPILFRVAPSSPDPRQG